jgi:hypothetical protein
MVDEEENKLTTLEKLVLGPTELIGYKSNELREFLMFLYPRRKLDDISKEEIKKMVLKAIHKKDPDGSRMMRRLQFLTRKMSNSSHDIDPKYTRILQRRVSNVRRNVIGAITKLKQLPEALREAMRKEEIKGKKLKEAEKALNGVLRASDSLDTYLGAKVPHLGGGGQRGLSDVSKAAGAAALGIGLGLGLDGLTNNSNITKHIIKKLRGNKESKKSN